MPCHTDMCSCCGDFKTVGKSESVPTSYKYHDYRGICQQLAILTKNTMQNACVSLAHINLQSYTRETICAGNKDAIPEDLLYEPRENNIAELSLVAFLMFTKCIERTNVLYVCAYVIEVLKFIPDFILMICIVIVFGCEV